MPTPRFRGYQRCSRIDYTNSHSSFQLTICVKPRRPVFITTVTNECVVAEIVSLQTDGACSVYVYCLMPDHIHLVVSPGPAGVSALVRRLKGRLAAWWRKHGDGQVLWESGYFDHRIRTSAAFSEKCEYVLQNQVRAGLVANAQDYRWSGILAVR